MVGVAGTDPAFSRSQGGRLTISLHSVKVVDSPRFELGMPAPKAGVLPLH
jgi:hypothetical protein